MPRPFPSEFRLRAVALVRAGKPITTAAVQLGVSAAGPVCGRCREVGHTLGLMARTLITGMSGNGKSTLLVELARRAHMVVDTDYDGWEDPHGFWDESRMTALLEAEPDLFVSGTVENQGIFYDRFDHVVLLSVPVDVLLRRVTARTNNPYGQTPEEQAEIRWYVVEVEPLLRAGASVELDGQQSVTELADFLEQFISSTRQPAVR